MRPNKEHNVKPEQEKKCNCGPECDCGCNEGKECTCGQSHDHMHGACGCGGHGCDCHGGKCGGKLLWLLLAFLAGMCFNQLWRSGCAVRCPCMKMAAGMSAVKAPLPVYTDAAGTIIIINAADGTAEVMPGKKHCKKHHKYHGGTEMYKSHPAPKAPMMHPQSAPLKDKAENLPVTD